MRILYVIKLAFHISGERVDYSTEVIVTTGKPSGKQESWIQTLIIHQNKCCIFQRFKLWNITTEIQKKKKKKNWIKKYFLSREDLSKYLINAEARKEKNWRNHHYLHIKYCCIQQLGQRGPCRLRGRTPGGNPCSAASWPRAGYQFLGLLLSHLLWSVHSPPGL